MRSGTIIGVVALVPLFLSLNVSGRLLVGSSDAKRVFYHSLGKVVYTGIVDKETYLRYGKCSLAKYDGSQVETSSYQSSYRPHFFTAYGSDAAKYSGDFKQCVKEYREEKESILSDIGLSIIVMGEFLYELRVSLGLRDLAAVEYAVNYVKRKIDENDQTVLYKVLDESFINTDRLVENLQQHNKHDNIPYVHKANRHQSGGSPYLQKADRPHSGSPYLHKTNGHQSGSPNLQKPDRHQSGSSYLHKTDGHAGYLQQH